MHSLNVFVGTAVVALAIHSFVSAAERPTVYGGRVVSPELNLRQQGLGADLGDAWGESLLAYAARWVGRLLDPDYIEAAYLGGGWEKFVKSPDDRNLFRGLNNSQQAERLRSDLDARELRLKGQSYDGAVYKSYDGASYARGQKQKRLRNRIQATGWSAISRSDVKRLQKALNDLGFSVGPADGIPGKRTKSALATFQRIKSLPVGAPDAATLSALGVK